MSDSDKQPGSESPIKLIGVKGSQLAGPIKSKEERILEAMYDLHLSIEGCATQVEFFSRPDMFQHLIGAFARTCSVFLRKMVLGERNDPKTRLLDEDTTQSLQITFDKIRKISEERATLEAISAKMLDGNLTITKINDNHGEPNDAYILPIQPIEYKISIDWPLPGAASFTKSPTSQKPWCIKPEELFDTNTRIPLNCNDWLAQQLVMFDNTGISLKDVLRTVVNYEGAHATNVARLSQPENDETFYGPANKPQLHILNNIRICGIKYNHIVVIETAIYLYGKIIQNELLKTLKEATHEPTICFFLSTSEDIFLNHHEWLSYDGGVMISYGGTKRVISHRIRAVR